MKSKGTERGLRALINCFGIPSDILQIKYFGGRNTTERPFFGDYSYYTSSLDKVRLDNTGSIIPKNTLSGNTSNIKRDSKYTDDLHNIEVGFAPSDNVDRYIISHSAATFNIDDYIGDPRSLTSPSYTGLYQVAEGILGNLERYDLQDYVRLIKFFDNVIFKMVKDFIPARVVADTGIIIKPNLLNRSKAKSVTLEVTRPEHTGSVDTAFIESRDGGVYYSGSTETITAYNRQIKTPEGFKWKKDHYHEEARYNGELYNSGVVVTNGELGKKNTYLNPIYPPTYYDINIYYTPPIGLCLLQDKPPGYATSGDVVDLAKYFQNTNSSTVFKVGPSSSPTVVVNNPTTYTFTGIAGTDFYVSATDPASINPCTVENKVTIQVCTLELVSNTAELVSPGQVLNLSSYIINPGVPPAEITYRVNGVVKPTGTYIVPSDAITAGLSVITLTIESNQGGCILIKRFNVNTVSTTAVVQNRYVTTAEIQVVVTNNSSNNTITETGIIWSTSPNPTIGLPGVTKLTSNASINAPFSIYPHPLTGNTSYYIKSYAITSLGTSYSPDVTLTTLQLGTTTLTTTFGASSFAFTVLATNPASLPIISIPSLGFSGIGINAGSSAMTPQNAYILEYTSPDLAFANYVTCTNITLTQSLPGVTTSTHTVSTQTLQSNTMYNFKARVFYKQGNSPHKLEISSSTSTNLVLALNVGDTFQGGQVISVIQNTRPTPSAGFFVNSFPTRRVLVLNPSDKGQTTAQSQAASLAQNPINNGGFPVGWRLPTRDEQIVLHGRFNLLGTAGTSLQGSSNKYYWNSNSWVSGFDGLRFTSTTTPIDQDDINTFNASGFPSLYIRSVRTATQNTL